MANPLELSAYRAKLEAALEKAIAVPVAQKLKEAISYSIFPAGKRIRPLLSLFMCDDLGGTSDHILPAASALELMHCSSLVHDDLPALDNDDFRRGKPSSHRAFGEATALLAGDAAISLALEAGISSELPDSCRVSIARELSRAYTELCDGQHLDLLMPKESSKLIAMYRKKTGALFGAACAIGAIGAKKEPNLVAAAREFGVELGTVFQLQDDLIDTMPEAKGREAGSDARNKKLILGPKEGSEIEDAVRGKTSAALENIELLASARLVLCRSLLADLL